MKQKRLFVDLYTIMKIFNLTINFEEKDHPSVVLPIAEGESVLDVCMEHGIELQHNCGGVCGCSTCHLYERRRIQAIPSKKRRRPRSSIDE